MATKTKGKTFKISDELNQSMVTTRFRASYVHLLEPWTGDEDKDPRYGMQMIFDKKDPWLKEAKARVKAIAVEAFGPNAVRLLQTGKLKNPFRDGDDERPGDDVYEGMVFINANGAYAGKKPPGLINQKKRDIRKMENPEEVFYSGCYARAEIKFYPFDQAGGKGIACYLFNVQKLAEGESLSGGRSADQVFDEADEDDEDVDDGFEDDDDF